MGVSVDGRAWPYSINTYLRLFFFFSIHTLYMYMELILFGHRRIQRKFAKHHKLTRSMSWKALVIHPQFHFVNTGLVEGMLYTVIIGILVLMHMTNKHHRLLKRRMKLSKTQCQAKKVGKKSTSSKAYPLKLSKLNPTTIISINIQPHAHHMRDQVIMGMAIAHAQYLHHTLSP